MTAPRKNTKLGKTERAILEEYRQKGSVFADRTFSKARFNALLSLERKGYLRVQVSQDNVIALSEKT